MIRSRLLLIAAGAVVLSACASAPPLRTTSASAPAALGHDLRVDVELNGQRVGGGQGTWFQQGVVLTTLDAVNDVPPTGELVVRAADGTRLSASLWAGGNPLDANAAYLFVHSPERFGALAELSDQPLCAQEPAKHLATHPGHSSPSSLDLSLFSASQPSLSGTVLRGEDGCISGLVAVREDRVEVVPLTALHHVAKGIPERETH